MQRPARIRRLLLASAMLVPVLVGARSASATTVATQFAPTSTAPFQTVTIREKAAISGSVLPDIGQNASLVLNGAGNPVIAYYDADRNAPGQPDGPFGNGDLKLMVCGNPTCTNGNTVTIIDRGRIYTDDAGRGASLALDPRGFPVISYFDQGAGLKLARCSDTTCARLHIQVVVNIRLSLDVANTSLVVDANGTPFLTFSNDGRVAVIRCTNANCDPKASGLGGTPAVVVRYLDAGTDNALALDFKGNPVISYYDHVRRDLRVIHCITRDCTELRPAIQVADQAGDVGRFNALRMIDTLDIRTGAVTSQRPFISYYDATNGDLKAVYCGDANCARNNFIQTLDRTGDVGQYTAMPKVTRGEFAISYYDATKHTLKLAVCDPGLPFAKVPTLPCQDTQANTVTTIDGAGELPFPGTADVGQFNSFALDAKGNPVLAYYDATNRTLKLAWR